MSYRCKWNRGKPTVAAWLQLSKQAVCVHDLLMLAAGIIVYPVFAIVLSYSAPLNMFSVRWRDSERKRKETSPHCVPFPPFTLTLPPSESTHMSNCAAMLNFTLSSAPTPSSSAKWRCLSTVSGIKATHNTLQTAEEKKWTVECSEATSNRMWSAVTQQKTLLLWESTQQAAEHFELYSLNVFCCRLPD